MCFVLVCSYPYALLTFLSIVVCVSVPQVDKYILSGSIPVSHSNSVLGKKPNGRVFAELDIFIIILFC